MPCPWLPSRGARVSLTTLLGALCLTLACSGETPEANARSGGGFERGPKPVATARVVSRSLDDVFLEREASLFAVAAPTISTQQEGFVMRLGPEVGDYVRRGDLLAQMDDTDRQLQRTEARAELTQARVALRDQERAWKRTEKLFKQNVISQGELDDRRSAVEIARAQVQREQATVSRLDEAIDALRVLAPADGVVTQLLTERGEYLNRGDGIYQLKEIDIIVAVCTVGERHLSDVDEGASVFVHVTAYPDVVFSGLIWKIVPDALVNSRSFTVKILLPNPNHALKPGMSARISFVRRLDRGLLVPKDAVLRLGDESYLMVVEDGRAVRRVVELGHAVGDQWHVRDGVSEAEEVIVSGNEKLNGGEAVVVVELPASDAPPASQNPVRASEQPSGAAGL